MASTRRNMMGTRGAALQLGHDSSLANSAFADDPDYEPEFEKLESDSVLAKYSLPIILLYLAGGTAFFAYSEEWEWTDSLYYSAVTLTTVGYGDMAPSNDASKIFAIGYIVGGLSIIATCLGVLVGQIQGSLDVTVIAAVLQNPPLWVLAAALAGGILTGLALHANTQPPSKPAKAA